MREGSSSFCCPMEGSRGEGDSLAAFRGWLIKKAEDWVKNQRNALRIGSLISTSSIARNILVSQASLSFCPILKRRSASSRESDHRRGAYSHGPPKNWMRKAASASTGHPLRVGGYRGRRIGSCST